MVQRPAVGAESGAEATLRRLLATDGTDTHPHVRRLSVPRGSARDLGDAVHALCAVHGQHPDLLTLVAGMSRGALEREWLMAAVAGFGAERATLAQLVAAAGPLPSTPGQAETAATLTTARHALEMLARSERKGVALGAAAALVGDWIAIRAVLARAADRFGVELTAARLPGPQLAFDGTDLPERAVAFGAQQLLAQHRGLWSLLEARASARGASSLQH